jgi:hypothetical protein
MADTSPQLFELLGPYEPSVVELPNVIEGGLADLIAAASAPGSPSELRGEADARALFASATATWSKPRRFGRPARAALVAASAASLFVTTTALAAASVLPAPATSFVDKALRHVDINMTPPASTPVRLAGSSNIRVASDPQRSVAPTNTGSHNRAVAGPQVHTGGCKGGSAACGSPKHTPTVHHGHPRTLSESAKYQKLLHEADAAGSGQTKAPSGTAGGTAGTTGNKGGTSNGTGPTGVNRGGNQPTGSGKKRGRGTGYGRRHHRKHDRHPRKRGQTIPVTQNKTHATQETIPVAQENSPSGESGGNPNGTVAN